MDLDYKNAAATGKGLPLMQPDQPYQAFVKSIEPPPGKLTCPKCRQTHEYGVADLVETTVPV
jgi:hypothetical protein